MEVTSSVRRQSQDDSMMNPTDSDSRKQEEDRTASQLESSASLVVASTLPSSSSARNNSSNSNPNSNPEPDQDQTTSNAPADDPTSIFSDLPLSALTANASSSNTFPYASAALASQRIVSENAPSISSSSTSASASPSSSPNVSRSSSIGQSLKGGSGRIRPGLLSRAGTDPESGNPIRPLSIISKGLPSSLLDGNQVGNSSSGGRNFSGSDRRSTAMRSTSASEDDEARLSDSGVIPRRFPDHPSNSNSSLNASGASTNSAPAATTSMNHPQRSASSYSGYSASSSRNSSPLVSPAGSISVARARQVFASPTSSPISSTSVGLPSAPNFKKTNPQVNSHLNHSNEPTSTGHVSETSSKSGSASLGRAQSVSSVSSVNSTSSLEAAPFRAAPLGNFRVGFGGYGRALGGYGNANSNNSNRRPQMMQRDKTLSGGNQAEKSNLNSSRAGMAIGTGGESSAAESEDGGNDGPTSKEKEKFSFPNKQGGEADFRLQQEKSESKGKQREGLPSSSSPIMTSAFDSANSSKLNAAATPEAGISPSRKQSYTPKLPSDAWQYRNAPGMGGSRHNSSIPASWGLAVAGNGHHRGSNSLSIPQSNTWSVGTTSSLEGSLKVIDLGNEDLLNAPSNSGSASHSPSRKHPNPSTFKSKLAKSASKLGIKPAATGGSGGNSPSGSGAAGGRPFIQLEGENLPESTSLRIDTAVSTRSIASSGGGGGLLIPSMMGTPLSAGTVSPLSGDGPLELAGLVGVAPSINSQDDSLPMSRTSSVTNAPLFVAKHGEGVGLGAGMSFGSGSSSPLPSPGIPAYVNPSKNAFGVWAFGVPAPRVSPKEEREKIVPFASSSSALSTSPGATRSNAALSSSSLAAIAPSSPLRTLNSVLSPSSSPSNARAANNSTPPIAAVGPSSPETPTTPLSRVNGVSNGTPLPSKKSTPLTPAQQVQAEVEAGTARAPSEPSGHTPGPTPVLPSSASSSRDRSGRNRSSHREREKNPSKEYQDQIRTSPQPVSHSKFGSQSSQSSAIALPSLPTRSSQVSQVEAEGSASNPQPASRDISKTRERERSNSSNIKLKLIPSDSTKIKKRSSVTPVSASAPSSPSLQASQFNLPDSSKSDSVINPSEGDHPNDARGRIAISRDRTNPVISKAPQRPSFLRALTSDSVFSNRSAGGKSSFSRNGSVLSEEGSHGSGSTSKPSAKREENEKVPSALGRERKQEETVEETKEAAQVKAAKEFRTSSPEPLSALNSSTSAGIASTETNQRKKQLDFTSADSLIAERRPLIEGSIDLSAADDGSLGRKPPGPSPSSDPVHQDSSENTTSSPSSSSPNGTSSSDSRGSSNPPPDRISSFGPSDLQAKSEAKTAAQSQAELPLTASKAGFVPPQFTRADTAFSSTSNAISTSSNSVAPASIKAPIRKLPGVYVPHADPSLIGNTIGRTNPVLSSDNGGSGNDGTAALNSVSPASSTPLRLNSSLPPSAAAVSASPSTPVPLSATSGAKPNDQTPAASPRTARGPKDFEFGEILGEGSYSTVLEAWDLLSGASTSDGSTVVQSTTAAAAAAGKTSSAAAARAGKKMYAVKVLDKMHILKEKKQKYVNVEREALSLLVKHPGVISLYWTFQDRESLYFVLQLAQNGELLTFIKKHGSFDFDSARYYAAQLIDTIGAMHRVGVIHRDIKPENVLLDGAMRVKVTDFGSARITRVKPAPAVPGDAAAAPSQERTNSFVGTAEYVSPELLGGKAAAEASDFWAFGCVLYQMIAGRPPFKGANEYQTFQKIIKREFEFPDGFPSDARDLVDRLLVLDPEKRLGYAGGVEEIKKHAFFSQMDFATLWSSPAPSISTGIYQRPAASITRRSEASSLNDFGSDGWVDRREAGSLLSEGRSSLAPSAGNVADDSRAASVSSADQASSAAPARSTTSVVDADDSDSDAQAGPRRARGLSTGEMGNSSGANGKRASNLLRLASAVTGKEWSATVGTKANRNSQRSSIIPPNVRHQLNHRFSSNSVNASSSSVDDFDQDETPTRGVQARRRHGSSVVPSVVAATPPPSNTLPPAVGWAGLLLPHEVLLYACPIIHRKTGTANMFSKKRQLILTDFPRLLCVKETADALKVKSEVILAMPQLAPSPSQTSDVLAPLPSSTQPIDFLPSNSAQEAPNNFEAKRRASHSAGNDATLDDQRNSNVSSLSPRGIPSRRGSWSANPLAVGVQATSVRGSSPDPDRERTRALLRANANAAPNMLIGVEARGNRVFVVHTPARSYLYEDPSGDSNNWIKVINSARGS